MTILTEYFSSVVSLFSHTTTDCERPQSSAALESGIVAPRPSLAILAWPTTIYLWLLRIFPLNSAITDTATTPLISKQAHIEDGQENAVERKQLSMATPVGASIATPEMVFKSVAISLSRCSSTAPATPCNSGPSTTGTEPQYSATTSILVSPRDGTVATFDIPLAADTVSYHDTPIADFVADTFYFGGLRVGTGTWADELARLDSTNEGNPTYGTVDTWSCRSSSEPDSALSDSPIIFDAEDPSALDLSDFSSSTSDESDSASLLSCPSSVVSSVRSVYSGFDHQAVVQSCASNNWTYVCRSELRSIESPGTSIVGIKDGNSSDYVESPYIPGCEPEEPVDLHHAGNTYFLRGERGKGSFGRVYMAHDYHGNLRAVKVLHKDKQYREKDGREILIQEKRALEAVARLRRPFLTPLLDSWADNENVYFVMPLYHRTLHYLLYGRKIRPLEIKLYIAEMVSGLASLHKAGIIHRDLKPENILIDGEGHIAIADFGLAIVLDERERENMDHIYFTGSTGTVGYMAPEVYLCEHPQTAQAFRQYNYKCDIWSLAATILDMVFGTHMYLVDFGTGHPSYKYNRRLEWEKIRDIELRRLLSIMMNRHIHKRPSAEILKTHPYFCDIDFTTLENETWSEVSSYVSPPRFPSIRADDRRATLKFTSFHNGLDSTMSPSERVVDDQHQLIPTPWVAKNRALDDEDPHAYEFTDFALHS
ncbi:hypothetical protein PHLGIDRAFT_189866 [Phlebiopsis gigantea 11061_1 CR5-6]|uniref:Protein kinase domain-containing protein n=1 Tax=Phlebiopsis gigantea (strain 11061_1 CR5-6) TaxID=745531 RepID=A0A0C3NI82_PHLG1|nr:hypothetical protein PHLGIDRAFT_189866 [Phlebiopsis gigantea 11061_1 CR5-6]